MGSPQRVSAFLRPGAGPKTLAREFGFDGDPPGAYVFLFRGKPIYVGISRGVLKRIRDHVRGKTHETASLAFQIARSRTDMGGQRNTLMADSTFHDAFEKAKEYLRGLRVAFIKIDNDLELYLFEAYAAMKLDTGWNSFRTH